VLYSHNEAMLRNLSYLERRKIKGIHEHPFLFSDFLEFDIAAALTQPSGV
jgi:hypothetical protein